MFHLIFFSIITYSKIKHFSVTKKKQAKQITRIVQKIILLLSRTHINYTNNEMIINIKRKIKRKQESLNLFQPPWLQSQQRLKSNKEERKSLRQRTHNLPIKKIRIYSNTHLNEEPKSKSCKRCEDCRYKNSGIRGRARRWGFLSTHILNSRNGHDNNHNRQKYSHFQCLHCRFSCLVSGKIETFPRKFGL